MPCCVGALPPLVEEYTILDGPFVWVVSVIGSSGVLFWIPFWVFLNHSLFTSIG